MPNSKDRLPLCPPSFSSASSVVAPQAHFLFVGVDPFRGTRPRFCWVLTSCFADRQRSPSSVPSELFLCVLCGSAAGTFLASERWYPVAERARDFTGLWQADCWNPFAPH